MIRRIYFRVVRWAALIYLEARGAAAIQDAQDSKRAPADRIGAATLATQCQAIILDIGVQQAQEAIVKHGKRKYGKNTK